MKERSINILSPEPCRNSNRSLLKLGGGLRYALQNKENINHSVDYDKEREIPRSYSIFSTQTCSPIKDDISDKGQSSNLIGIFNAWKEFIKEKHRSWMHLKGKMGCFNTKYQKMCSFAWKMKEKHLMTKIIYVLRLNAKGKKRGVFVFMRKYVRGWRKFVQKRNKILTNCYVLSEKVLGKLEKRVFGMWRRVLNKKKLLKKVFRIKTNHDLKKAWRKYIKSTERKSKILKTLQFLLSKKGKTMKKSCVSIWRSSIFIKKNQETKFKADFFEEKIRELMKQIVIQSQELAREKQESNDRETKMKNMLNAHADKLYQELTR
ncbi:hypothetical protein SteCoe_28865 [Stentor coeruleus]|uniref:Sfi1 spindle body domain-containing protein n=1 Tax=Stentor coeruleus TaxID=5963 RepID=A0A1R2B7Q3_9CILI|nr:hypothetical protein SteCoe_28865 [Stentor coeruleus]